MAQCMMDFIAPKYKPEKKFSSALASVSLIKEILLPLDCQMCYNIVNYSDAQYFCRQNVNSVSFLYIHADLTQAQFPAFYY